MDQARLLAFFYKKFMNDDVFGERRGHGGEIAAPRYPASDEVGHGRTWSDGVWGAGKLLAQVENLLSGSYAGWETCFPSRTRGWRVESSSAMTGKVMALHV